MATFFTHAALPLLAGRSFIPAGQSARRFLVAATICAVAPDLDFLGYAFDVRPPALLGHRGLTHSLPFAAALAAILAAAFFPALLRAPRELLKVWLGLFGWGATHGLVDAFTFGDVGVALFAPISSVRLHLPFHPVPVVPLGFDEALGRWGALVVFNELLLIVVPAVLLSRLIKRGVHRASVRRLAAVAIAWVAVAIALKAQFPEHIAPVRARALKSFGLPGREDDPALIPVQGLPEGRLVTRLDELKALGLFDADLTPAVQPWSSSFFPSWHGGVAGRWQDSRLTLIGRTLTGVTVMTAPVAARLLDEGQTLGLAPLEKLDLALGDPTLTSTRMGLLSTHNRVPHPRFWFGNCNGVAVAGMIWPEPFRTVDAIAPGGQRVRFLPTDIKALLAVAYSWMNDTFEVGGVCERVSLDPGKDCSMNPGGVVLATLNRLGLARTSFLVDVHPSLQSQNYAVARARVNLVRGPYPFDGRATTPRLEGRVTALADVEIRYEVSSTTLGYGPGNVRAPGADDTRYQRVGLHPVKFGWSATLALDEGSAIVGGQWTGDPPDGPDTLSFIVGGPSLADGGVLELNTAVHWDVIEALARASIDGQAASPTVDMRVFLDGGR